MMLFVSQISLLYLARPTRNIVHAIDPVLSQQVGIETMKPSPLDPWRAVRAFPAACVGLPESFAPARVLTLIGVRKQLCALFAVSPTFILDKRLARTPLGDLHNPSVRFCLPEESASGGLIGSDSLGPDGERCVRPLFGSGYPARESPLRPCRRIPLVVGRL